MTATAAPTTSPLASPAAAGAPLAAPAPGSAQETEHDFSMVLWLHDGYMQVVDFGMDGVTPLVVDETHPLGAERGPNPARLLGAAVGGCLGASLLYCLRKARLEVTDLRTTVAGTLVRNDRGRLRIGALQVHLAPSVPEAERARMGRCLDLFEDFCIVTQSVREGIDVSVEVEPRP
jgi:organic hydroperoxide reductase OsmC/OhrA